MINLQPIGKQNSFIKPNRRWNIHQAGNTVEIFEFTTHKDAFTKAYDFIWNECPRN